MGTYQAATVDVRDMLCAQALAVVAKAIRGVTVGQTLAVWYNAQDVRRDLLVWAGDQGHAVSHRGVDMLHIERRR